MEFLEVRPCGLARPIEVIGQGPMFFRIGDVFLSENAFTNA